jgi:hypothetical protein
MQCITATFTIKNVWFLLEVQFWPRIRYGLCSSTATIQELNQALHCKYYQILPLGGIFQTTTVKSRTINARFFGIGLPHLGVKVLIAMSDILLMHYGCKTASGQFMHTFLPYCLSNWASCSNPFRNLEIILAS